MSPKVTIRNAWTTNEQENPSKCQKVPTIEAKSFSGTLVEVDSLQQVRWRIFLHWSHRISPSSTQMIEADQNFKLSIIKRRWEDQLRLKHDDFESECDLYMACLIRQK
ncbi:unnamed protein product [Rotaria magnacalcarata]|uniref:Uncharacterized protein n=1 Tax=Rotaria magnacalcarata TaxID=392030 RepID=A0A816EH68_9BILA|nr:unnamed protein product [Rotaria magnacalcarata]